MSEQATAESGTRARTRRAILDAAVRVLSANPAAPLAEVAAAAEVGRTTLHRYFPERTDLLQALSHDAFEQATAATARARLGEGPAAAALERLCQEQFELGDILMLIFNDPQLMSGSEWEDHSEADQEILDVIARGQADGTIDPKLPPGWIHYVIWSLLYTAWEHARENHAPKHEALSLCLLSLRRIMSPGS